MAELEIKSRLLTRSLVLSSGTLVRPPEMQKVKQARRNGPVLIRRALAGSEYLKYLAAEPLSSHTSDFLFLQRFLQRLCPISRTHFLGGREVYILLAGSLCMQRAQLSLISYFTFKTKT